jgi:alpha/beta superfamily hydrolase
MKHWLSICALLLAVTLLAGCQPVAVEPTTATSAFDMATVTARHAELTAIDGALATAERVVSFQSGGETVIGTLTLPQDDGASAPFPVVLILPGLTNTRNSLVITGTQESLYGRAARVLGEHGIASLRIDFRGLGDSGGDWSDSSFTGQIEDALAAHEFVAAQPEIDATRLGLIGLSQGGLVAAEVARRVPEVDSVVLWSPVSNPPDTYKFLMGDETVAAGLTAADPGVKVVLPWGAEFMMKSGFFQDLYAVNPVGAIAEVEAPLLVAVGLQDTTVVPQPYQGETYLNYHEGPEKLVEVDSDHVFSVLTDGGTRFADEVIAWSLAWLEESLPVGE